jgi:hypothetical protein
VLPVANPKTKGYFVFKLLFLIASLISYATFFEAYALVGKNFGYIF